MVMSRGHARRRSLHGRYTGSLNAGVVELTLLFRYRASSTSSSQSQLVACILNNSLKPMSLRANSLLSTAEPVQCISGSGSVELSKSLFADSERWDVDVVVWDEVQTCI